MASLGVPRLRTFTGQAIAPHLDAVARLRIEVFREFPYLYAGDPTYERSYLEHYAASPRSLFVLAFEPAGVHVIGASTALPLCDADDAFRAPFEAHGPPPETVYYFGESVLEARWRGHGLGHRFFDLREARASELGFEVAAFAAVERPSDHPLRPASYRPLDAFWRKRGYEKRPGLRTTFTWQDLDEASESPKPMVFWTRAL